MNLSFVEVFVVLHWHRQTLRRSSTTTTTHTHAHTLIRFL